MKCNIRIEGGQITVTEDNGQPSELFRQAKEFYGSQNKAVDLWAMTKTDEFKDLMDDENVTLDEALKFIDVVNSNKNMFSADELMQVRDFMERNQVESLSELSSTLNTIFKQDGTIGLDEQAALDSGMYTREDLETIDLVEVGKTLTKLDGTLKVTDIEIEVDGTLYDDVKSQKKTIFETSERMSLEEVSKVVIEEIQPNLTDEEFMLALQELPFNDLHKQAQEDRAFFKQLKDSVDNTVKLQKVEIGPDGELRISTSKTYETVKSTLPIGTNTSSLRARLNKLLSFTDFAWSREDKIRKVLVENVENFSNYNIDLVGLDNLWNNREQAESLIAAAIQLLENPTEANIQNFADIKDELLGEDSAEVAVKLDSEYNGLNIVRMETALTNEELFSRFGLIKIADNTYHKVSTEESLDDVYEYLYDMYLNDEIEIPAELKSINDKSNPSNKVDVLKDLSKYINTRETGIELGESREKVSALQVAYNHIAIPTTTPQQKMRGVSKVITPTEELLNDFVPEFYNYYIREKQKGSEIYNRVLSKLRFTERGIIATEYIESLQGVEHRVELEDYIRLKRDSDMDHLVDEGDGVVAEDLQALNYPETVQEQQGTYLIKGEFLILPNTSKTFAKVNGRLFRQVLSKPNQTLYQEISLSEDQVYFEQGVEFEFDVERATEFFNDHELTLAKNSAERSQEILEGAKFNNVEEVQPTTEEGQEIKAIKDQAMADGTFMEAPNGNPTNLTENQWLQTRTKAFKDWFGDWIGDPQNASKVVDANGEPLVIYRGDNEEFTEFDRSKTKGARYGKLFNLTSDKSFAYQHGNLRSFFVNSRNPLDIDNIGNAEIDKLIEGVNKRLEKPMSKTTEDNFRGDPYKLINTIIRSDKFITALSYAGYTGVQELSYNGVQAVIDPNQIKSATENTGEFSAESNDIRYQIISEKGASQVQDLEGNTYSVNESDITTYETEFGPIRYITNENGDMVMLSDKNTGEFLNKNAPIEVVQEVVSRLQETGLATEVFQMNTTELEAILSEAGVSSKVSKQVIGWHGTRQAIESLSKETPSTKFGELLKGTYYGDVGVAAAFSGYTLFDGSFEETSTVFKASIDDTSFESIDMKNNVPRTDEELIAIIGRSRYDEILEKKKSGEIKGIKLRNAEEMLDGVRDNTQYVVFDNDVVEVIDTFRAEAIGRVAPASDINFQKQMEDNGVTLLPNGFVHEGKVYLNTDNLNIETPVHEFGHLYNSWLKETSPEKYKKGIDLIKGELSKDNSEIQTAIDYVKKTQPNLTGERLHEEILAQVIGETGAEIINSNSNSSIAQWLRDAWDSIKGMLGLSEMTVEQVMNMNLGEYSRAMAVDLLSGEFIGVDGEANYQRWKGENREVSSLEIQGVRTGEPIVAKVLHGTTNTFYEFDSSKKGNVEGHLGKVNYFTSDYQDASSNYLADGMDLTTRVTSRAESINQDIIDKEFTDIDGNLDYGAISQEYNIEREVIEGLDIDEVSEAIAKEELVGNEEVVLEVYVKLNNPVVLGQGRTWFDALSIDETYLEDATSEIAEENDITEGEAREEHFYEIRERALELQGDGNLVFESLEKALEDNGYDINLVSEILGDNFYESEVDLGEIESSIREGVLYENYDGDMASSQVVSDFFKNLGFDGIILTDVSKRFKGMGLGSGTSHVHVFNEYSNQIKLSDGTNTTFGSTSDIRYQQPVVAFQIDATDLLSGQQIGQTLTPTTENKTFTHKGVEIHYKKQVNPITEVETGAVEVDLITTPEELRGQGLAREAMQEFVKLADRQGLSLYLIASPRDKTTTTEGLIDFYESVGFRSGRDFQEEMTRRPRRVSEESVLAQQTEIVQQELGYNEDLSQEMLSILHSEIKVLDLYDESQQGEIDSRLDECN